MFAMGIDSELRAQSRCGMKIPIIAYHGISLVSDNGGGVQVYYERLDTYYDDNNQLQLGEQEKDNPSWLWGVGF
jgi:hypothetical protein